MKAFIGCDPGMNGCITAITSKGIKYIDMPEEDECRVIEFADKTYKFRLPSSIAIFNFLKPFKGSIAVIEEVHVDSRDTNNMVTAEILVRSQQIVIDACLFLDIKVHRLATKTWRKSIGLPSGASKDDCLQFALKHYPRHQSHLRYGRGNRMIKKFDRAESLCMAHLAKLIAIGEIDIAA